MIKYIYEEMANLFFQLKREKQTILLWFVVFVSGFVLGIIFVKNTFFHQIIILKNFWICLLLLTLSFIVYCLLFVAFSGKKGCILVEVFLVLLRGFLFYLFIKSLFLTYSIVGAVCLFIPFFVFELVILLQNIQFLIYYCRHNISVFENFSQFLINLCIKAFVFGLIFCIAIFLLMNTILLIV